MPTAPLKHRKLNRLDNYDYSQNGYYFITICAKEKIELSEIGKITNQCWLEIPKHFPDVILDEFVIMPNHMHGIIIIENNVAIGNNDHCFEFVGNENFRSLRGWHGAKSHSLSSIIRGFKIGVTKWCRQNNNHEFLWQKSFYDHIIRDEKSLAKIREYIVNNPAKWDLDRNNSENLYM